MDIQGHVSNNRGTFTVVQFLKEPTVIKRFLDLQVERNLLSEQLFQTGFNAPGGAVSFYESASGYMNVDQDEDLAIAEGAEYPEVYMTEPEQSRANTRKFAISSWLTFEDVDRDQRGQLARAMTRMRNTIVRNIDRTNMNMLRNNPKIRDYPAANEWDVPTTTTIFDDLFESVDMVEDESAGESYNATTLVVSNSTHTKLLRNKDIRDAFNRAPQQTRENMPIFTGSVGNLAGLNVLKSPHMPDDVAYVLQPKAIGGIADEVPLTVKPVERDESRDVYWLRAKRLSATFLSDPNAIVRITGIKTP